MTGGWHVLMEMWPSQGMAMELSHVQQTLQTLKHNIAFFVFLPFVGFAYDCWFFPFGKFSHIKKLLIGILNSII